MSERDSLKAKISKRAMELITPVVENWSLSYAEGGPMVKELERQFERVQGQPGVAVVNCTIGLEMVIRALGLQGKRIVVPANGMAADALAVLNAGAIPVFVDVDREFGGLLSDLSLRNVVWSKDGCGAVLLVHIGGIDPCSAEIKRLCEERGIFLIEDCAHVMGDPDAGLFGDAAVYSMFATKVLPAGEGGVVSGPEPLVQCIRRMRMHGRTGEWTLSWTGGTNAKMSELNAAFGVAVLEHARKIIRQRTDVCRLYEDTLGQGWFGGVGYKYVISSPRPEKVVALNTHGVFSGPIFRVPLPEYPAFAHCEVFGEISGAKEFCSKHVCLKTDVSLEEAKRIAKVVQEVGL